MNTTLANTCCYRMRNSNNRSDDSIPRGSIYVRSIYLDMIEPQSKRRSMQIILLNTRRRLRSALVHNDGSICCAPQHACKHTIYAHNVCTQYMHTMYTYNICTHVYCRRCLYTIHRDIESAPLCMCISQDYGVPALKGAQEHLSA